MTIEEFKKLCDLTVELTKVRQKECAHLSVENFAPELLFTLMRATHQAHLDQMAHIEQTEQP